jgi:arylsulfatase A-like enzyme
MRSSVTTLQPLTLASNNESASQPMNVLHIIADDARPEMKVYGRKHMHTPNLDALAHSGLLFENAYAQVACCVPSRNSFLSGRRPSSTRVWGNHDHVKSFRDAARGGREWITLPEHFKRRGYTVLGAGKIFHPDFTHASGVQGPRLPFTRPTPDYVYASCPGGDETTWCVGYTQGQPDVEVAQHAVDYLREVARDRATPFYIMAGFLLPHQSWSVQPSDWDTYSRVALPEPVGTWPPNTGNGTWWMFSRPAVAFGGYETLNEPTSTKDGYPWSSPRGFDNPKKVVDLNMTIEDGVVQEARRAYFASMTSTDRHVGTLLSTLDRLGLKASTIVLMHGDHGYQLGEQNQWHKGGASVLATRVPLIIRVPGKPAGRTDCMFELVDLYPTLAGLTGGAPEQHLEGNDLSGLFDAPQRSDLKTLAFTEAYACYARGSSGSGFMLYNHFCTPPFEGRMGYTVVTQQYKLTVWPTYTRSEDPYSGVSFWPAEEQLTRFWHGSLGSAGLPVRNNGWDWRQSSGEGWDLELYDVSGCRENYDSCESDNLAGRAEHAQVQASLVEKLFTHHKVAASGRSGDVE